MVGRTYHVIRRQIKKEGKKRWEGKIKKRKKKEGKKEKSTKQKERKGRKGGRR